MQAVDQKKYSKYLEEVREAVESRVGGSVTIRKVNKNNGLVMDGLTITQKGVNIAPTIYLNSYFEDYISEGAAATAERIIAVYEDNKPKESIDVSFFTDIERVRPAIEMKLVNYGMNKVLLEQVPHVRFLDLAVVFIVVLEANREEGVSSILVYNQHLELWNIGADDLYKTAVRNVANDFEITPMFGIKKSRLSILTNHYKMYGAAGMLYKELLNQYMEANQAGKIAILPSSIHEVLLMTCDGSVDMGCLKNMVKEVNATQVEPEEVLSGNVYIYDGSEITIAE